MGACTSRDGGGKTSLHSNAEDSVSVTHSANVADWNGERRRYKGKDQIAEELEEEISAIKCIFCERTLRSSRAERQRIKDLESVSFQWLREGIERRDVDMSWCLERGDLVQVHNLVSAVCLASECQKLLKQSCSRVLECGHRCGGVRGERTCLPCLEDGYRSGPCAGRMIFTSGDELCAICMVDPIKRAPAILLTCGHVVHAHCAKRKIAAGFPGPEISFTFLECPLCPQVMEHPILVFDTTKHEVMKDQVREMVIERLKEEQMEEERRLKRKASESSKRSNRGAGHFARLWTRTREFVARPFSGWRSKSKVDNLRVESKVEVAEEEAMVKITEELVIAAMKKYQYYVCFKCKVPYFGGINDCVAGIRGEDGYDPRELMCGGCSAAESFFARCKVAGHGTKYIEYKCKFCCSVAVFVCLGEHTCAYHHDWDMYWRSRPEVCVGPGYCRLGIEHPPNGKEFCLGCSLCRMRGQ